jgi:hypothetical protein
VLVRAIVSLVLCATLGASSGCRVRKQPPPYAAGAGPTPELLLGLAAPQVKAMTVPDAKVIANRVLRGNLAFLAQAPARFRGSVQVSGNELVTLAFHEEGYALRYKLDAYPTGFYHGPPSPCAVEALLGVAISEEGLVAAVLGGAPVIAEPHEVLQQGWDRKDGVEKLVIANASFVEELRFDLVGSDWQFVGARLWQRNADKSKGKKLWSLDHEDLHRVGGAMLPERTAIRAPGKRRDNLVVIVYRDRDLDPEFAKTMDDGGATADGGATTDDGATGWDDDDGGGWEGDDEGGWEGEAPAKPGDATPPSAATPGSGSTTGGGAPPSVADASVTPPVAEQPGAPTKAATATAPAKAPPKLPPVFRIDDKGLKDRGDLCR